MALHNGWFVRKDDTKGTTPLDARLGLAGLISAPGVLTGGTVTGLASWAYSVAAGVFASSRGSSDGVVVFANDSSATVGTTGEGDTIPPAPSTGSRIDIIYALHRDVDNGDPDSEPRFGVASGTASGSPVAPTLPTGAVELGRATVAAGATNTAHANVTISHAERPVAVLRGVGEQMYTATVSTLSGQTANARVATVDVPAQPYTRVVEYEGVLNAAGATSAWEAVVTSAGDAIASNRVRAARLPFSAAAVGGSATVSGSFNLAANTATRVSLWVGVISAGTLNMAASQFQVRVRRLT